jgi:hypothetical protein
MEPSLLALAIASLTYAVSLALMSMPVRELKAWGRSAFMHSITGVALISAIPGLIFLRSLIAPYVEPYLGVDISVGPEKAFAHLGEYQKLIREWIDAVNLSAIAIGEIEAVLMLALTPAMLAGGVGVLFATIASYLFSSVFGLLILAQRFFSALYLFSQVVGAFLSLVPVIAPGMFTVGLILYATPFARKLGKTLIVFGAALTLILPPIVVATLPSPEKAEEELRKTREIQVYSIALDKVRQVNAGVKINIFDRNGTIEHVGGNGTSFHDSRMLKYPYFKLELQGRENAPPLIIDCSTLPPDTSCEEVAQAVAEMLKQPETGFIDSGQEKIGDGYRVTLTMPEPAGPGRRAGTYTPDAWILGLWMYVQGDTGKRDEHVRIFGREIETNVSKASGKSGQLVCGDVGCWWEENTSGDFYEDWKAKWEAFWSEAPYKKLYLENAVQEGNNTSLIWFTATPVGRDAPLNIFIVWPGVQDITCRINGTRQEGNETRYRYGIFMNITEVPITYFVYLDGAQYSIDSDPPGVEVREVNASELAGRVVRKAEILSLDPSIEVVGNSTPPRLEASPPAHYMLVYLPGGGFGMGVGDTCEEAYLHYLENLIKDLMIEEYVYGNNTSDPHLKECFQNELNKYKEYLNSTNNESGNYTGSELIVEPDEMNSTASYVRVGMPCETKSGTIPLSVTVEFKLLKESPIAPWKPEVEWDKFEEDEKYLSAMASGGIVSEKDIQASGININVETHREEWDDYPIFRLGLYRDGPVHYGQRLVVEKLMEYRSMSWAQSPIASMVYNTFKQAAQKASTMVPFGGVPIPSIDVLVKGDRGVSILDAIARLLGHTAALAMALIIFAVSMDTISGLIGGQSVGKAVLASPMAGLMKAFYGGGMVAGAFRQASKVSVLGHILARREQRKQLKSAEEERKLDKMKFKEADEKRMASMRLPRRAVERVKSRVGEGILTIRDRLEEKGGVLGKAGSLMIKYSPLSRVSNSYILSTHRYLLRTDPAYASRHLEQARYVSQMRPVAMTPEKWAQGMAHMIKTAPTRLERIALVDRIARDTRIGRNILIKDALGGLAEEVSRLTGGRINIPISRDIKAPAAFAIAAENASKPLVDDLGGVRPDIPHVIPASFSVGLVTRGLDHVEVPYIHNREGEGAIDTLKEIYGSVSFYDTYSRPLSPDEKSELSQALANVHIEHLRPDLRLDGNIAAGWHVELEAPPILPKEFSDSRMDGNIHIELEKPGDIDGIPTKIFDGDFVSRTVKDTVKLSETHEGSLSLTEPRGGYWIPSDVLKAFPWTAQDALDKFASEGYSFSEALDKVAGERVEESRWWLGQEPQPQNLGSQKGGWWNE